MDNFWLITRIISVNIGFILMLWIMFLLIFKIKRKTKYVQKVANELIKETNLTIKPLEDKVKRLEFDLETLIQEKQTILKLDETVTTRIQSLKELNLTLFRLILGLLIGVPLIVTTIFLLWLIINPGDIIAIWGAFGGIIIAVIGASLQFKEVRNFIRRLLRSSTLE